MSGKVPIDDRSGPVMLSTRRALVTFICIMGIAAILLVVFRWFLQ